MINVSNNYKQALTQPRTIDAKITYGNNTILIDNINSIKRSFNSTLFKTIAKQVIIDSNTTIAKDTTINPQFGIYIDTSFEYVSLGSYKVKNAPNLNKDTNSYEITAYDKIVDSMVSYELTNSDITYPCTVRQLFVAIFTKLGWSTSGIPATFVNSTSQIEEDVYSNVNFTYRDVLDELCTISCMFLIDVNGTPTLKQKTITSETINEDFMSDTNVQIKNQVFFNSLVFSRASNSDNIYRKDDTSIANNGLHEFKVSDLQILSLNWRDNFIDAMWNYIKTFTYYAYEVNTLGITYLEPIDTFTLSTFGSTYSTILLNSDLTIANGVNEKIYANEPLESETEYKYADTTDKRINQTNLIVDKQNGRIDAVVSQVQEIEEDIQNPTSIKENKYFDLEDALDEPLIDFSLYGETQQDSTTGYNLYEGANDLYSNIRDVSQFTLSKENDGGIKLTKTSTGSTSPRFYVSIPSNETYTVSLKVKGNASKCIIGVWLNNFTPAQQDLATITPNTNNYQQMSFTFNYTSGDNLRIFIRNADSTFSELNQYIIIKDLMIEKGNTMHNWEPYTNGASPNPDYPQEIHNVSGDNTIEICGKNLWDFDNRTMMSASSSSYNIKDTTKIYNAMSRQGNRLNNYVTYTSNPDGSMTISTTISYYGLALPFKLIPNETYTISAIISDKTKFSYGIGYFDSEGNYISDNSSYHKDFLTFTVPSNAYITNICICPTSSNTDITLSKIQLEKGNQSSEYEAYTGNSQLISLGSIELCKISTYQDYIYKENDRWFLHKEIGKVVLDGSEEGWTKTKYTFANESIFTGQPLSLCSHFTNAGNVWVSSNEAYRGKYTLTNVANTFKCMPLTNMTTSDFKTWLSTHNTTIYYVLSTPTDTEITDTTLLEQLNRLMTLPLYKDMTHITLTPNDLQPTMKIEYYRDTSINENFVPKEDMTKYYTKTETNAQIQISNSSIQQSVSELSNTVNNNTGSITTISSQVTSLQSSTSLQINAINTQLENGVEKLTNSLVRIDTNGINTSRTNETFNTQITNKTFEVKDGTKELAFIGYDNTEKRTVARMDDLESKRAIIGVHRCETITRNGKKRTAWFYVGGGN